MLFGSSRVREVPNQLSRQLIYFGALEIVKFLTSETVNRRTDDGRYVDALTMEEHWPSSVLSIRRTLIQVMKQ